MPRDRKYKAVPRPLSTEDKVFIKLVSEGMKKTHAFKIAYPNHESVMRYMDVTKDKEDAAVRTRAAGLVIAAAKNKLQTQRIQGALVTYQSRMDLLAEDALDVAEKIMKEGKSEKVRADLSVEFIRHKVGTPVVKQQIQEDKTVVLVFGDKIPDRNVEAIIEAEVVEEKAANPLTGVFNQDSDY